MLKINNLKNAVPDHVIEQLSKIKEIDGPLRLSHFLSQCHHESAGFTRVEENLNYSERGLLKTFRRHFATALDARAYARRPEEIANRVYCERMGNGNEFSGDGWRHRGFGYLQCTGKDNQFAFADYVGDPEIKKSPILIAVKYPLESAAWFFTENNIWSVCDKGSSVGVVTQVTKKVNGGLNGINERLALFRKFYRLVK